MTMTAYDVMADAQGIARANGCRTDSEVAQFVATQPLYQRLDAVTIAAQNGEGRVVNENGVVLAQAVNRAATTVAADKTFALLGRGVQAAYADWGISLKTSKNVPAKERARAVIRRTLEAAYGPPTHKVGKNRVAMGRRANPKCYLPAMDDDARAFTTQVSVAA